MKIEDLELRAKIETRGFVPLREYPVQEALTTVELILEKLAAGETIEQNS